jgi:uncharacterized protein YecT (DUF1311 family)
MKRISLILLVTLLSVTLISCGDNETKSSNNTVVEEKTDTIVVKENKDTKVEVSKKQAYTDKLQAIKAGLKDLESYYAGNTIEMKYAASEEYARWDAALNEIYGVLKTQLSTTEMSALEKEEVQWIKDKTIKAEKAAAEWAGGTGEQLQYTSSIARTTMDRCYELVNNYMK